MYQYYLSQLFVFKTLRALVNTDIVFTGSTKQHHKVKGHFEDVRNGFQRFLHSMRLLHTHLRLFCLPGSFVFLCILFAFVVCMDVSFQKIGFLPNHLIELPIRKNEYEISQ